MSDTSPSWHRLLAATALAVGLSIGLAATAGAQPASDDFWECAGDHQDTDGIGVCCVFYGGDYDETQRRMLARRSGHRDQVPEHRPGEARAARADTQPQNGFGQRRPRLT
jgi:hypothetical protein